MGISPSSLRDSESSPSPIPSSSSLPKSLVSTLLPDVENSISRSALRILRKSSQSAPSRRVTPSSPTRRPSSRSPAKQDVKARRTILRDEYEWDPNDALK